MIIKNFLFHRVTDEEDKLWPPMKPELFQKIIQHLTKHYTVVNLEVYLKIANSSDAKNKKPLATVLFDDGYKDNIEYAAPILKKHNCPASFYIATDCIDRNVPTWTYIVDCCLQKTQRSVLELDFNYVPEELKQIILHPKSHGVLKKLKPWMKTVSNTKRTQVMQAITAQCNDVAVPGNQMMNWNDVRQLHAGGFTIGSHSKTHPMLGKLEEEQEIEEELTASFQTIATQVGTAPEAISYPIGSYDERVISLSKKAGYNMGLAVKQRFFDTNKNDRFAVPRVELYQEPWYKVTSRIHGIYNAVKRLWK